MAAIPYVYRLAALGAFVCLALLYDLRHPPGQRRRCREYTFLLSVGVVGAVFASLLDQATCSISPDYFTLGKGIADGEGFRWRVAALGAKAGLWAGLVWAGVLLVIDRGRSRPHRLWGYAALGLVCSAAFAVVFGAGRAMYSVFGTGSGSDVAGLEAYSVVWWTHLGAHGGALLGLLYACVRVRR